MRKPCLFRVHSEQFADNFDQIKSTDVCPCF
nr:MAG TPA: hypothetical protein [Caudoviricetes sp.]